MILREELRLPGLSIFDYSKVRTCFKPNVIRLTGMISWRIEILLRMCRRLEQFSIDIGRKGLSFKSGSPKDAPALLPVQFLFSIMITKTVFTLCKLEPVKPWAKGPAD